MSEKICPRCDGSGRVPDKRLRLSIEEFEIVHQMKAAGVPQREIAARLGVTESLVSRIVGRRIGATRQARGAA